MNNQINFSKVYPRKEIKHRREKSWGSTAFFMLFYSYNVPKIKMIKSMNYTKLLAFEKISIHGLILSNWYRSSRVWACRWVKKIPRAQSFSLPKAPCSRLHGAHIRTRPPCGREQSPFTPSNAPRVTIFWSGANECIALPPLAIKKPRVYRSFLSYGSVPPLHRHILRLRKIWIE